MCTPPIDGNLPYPIPGEPCATAVSIDAFSARSDVDMVVVLVLLAVVLVSVLVVRRLKNE